jgi:hypothetical protein
MRLTGDRFGSQFQFPEHIRLVRIWDKQNRESGWIWRFPGGYLLGLMKSVGSRPTFVVKTALTSEMFSRSQQMMGNRYIPMESKNFAVAEVLQ